MIGHNDAMLGGQILEPAHRDPDAGETEESAGEDTDPVTPALQSGQDGGGEQRRREAKNERGPGVPGIEIIG